jgi:hypothetical protein
MQMNSLLLTTMFAATRETWTGWVCALWAPVAPLIAYILGYYAGRNQK